MKTKKISWQAIAIVALALVLIAAIALGVSGAWFQDQDSATTTATLGEAVTVKLADATTGDAPVTWQGLYTGEAFPGDTVLGTTKVMPGSDSGMVLRYKVSTIVKDGATEVTDSYIDTYTEVNMPTYYKGTLDEFRTQAKASLALLTTEINNGIVAAANWGTTKSTAGYFYYTKVVQSTADIALFETGVTIPKGVTNEAAEWTVEISLTVEAMQAANITDAENPWSTDLTADVTTAITEYNDARTI
ncbi:MAG: hypothetical protein ACI4T2_03430 [Christensenellales bacterium]